MPDVIIPVTAPSQASLTKPLRSRYGAPASQNFPALDGLRFLAAISVVLFHYAPTVSNFNNLPVALRHIIAAGPAAVPFFFILSGFVLAHRYHNAQLDNSNSSRVKFWSARLARIYPAYFLAFVLFLPIAIVKYITHVGVFLPNGLRTFTLSALLSCLLLQAWTPFAQSWNGPGWSVSVEAFFYLIFPFLIARFRSRKFTFCLVSVLLCLLPLSLATAQINHALGHDLWDNWIRNNPLVLLPLFCVGTICGLFCGEWRLLPVSLQKSATAIAPLTLVSVAALCPDHYRELLVYGAVVPIMAVLVLSFTGNSGIPIRLMSAAPLVALGRASYILYIIQAPIWHYYQTGIFKLHLLLSRPLIMSGTEFVGFLVTLIALSLSLATDRFLDPPLRRLVAAISNRTLSGAHR